MKLKWTLTAEENLVNITDYILGRFTKKEVNFFFLAVHRVIGIVFEYPEIGSFYNQTIYRHILISKQTYLFYKVENNTVYLVTFFNNSQDPQKLLSILYS